MCSVGEAMSLQMLDYDLDIVAMKKVYRKQTLANSDMMVVV